MTEKGESFKKAIDLELAHINIDKLDLNDDIFNNISLKDRFKNIWDKEIEISTGVFTGALCIFIAMVIIFNISAIGITEKEIRESKVEIISLSRGGI